MQEDDIFHPAVNEEQIRRAEEMLGDLNLAMFVEKRSSSNKYKPGTLTLSGQNARTIKVLVSAALEEQPGDRALIATEAIPQSNYAELVIKEADQETRLQGHVEASHLGQRKDDGELNVTLFHGQSE